MPSGSGSCSCLANHPWFDLVTLTASERSAGKKYGDVVNWKLDAPFPEKVRNLAVSPTTVAGAKGVELVFSALPAEIAGQVEDDFSRAGVAVCSNARSHRMEPDIPLVIPEVNGDHLALIDTPEGQGP